jgi:hypothetical protein
MKTTRSILPRACMLAALFSLIFLIAPSQIGAASETDFAPTMSLERALNADGTLNLASAADANLDVRGWSMTTLPNGAPRFVRSNAPQAAGDEKWDGQFTVPGTNGIVYAMAVKGNDVYVGGAFTQAGGANYGYIAKWNTASGTWAALGNGTDGEVDALVFKGSDLYVGGVFTQVFNTAGAVPASGIAKWSTTKSLWTAVGVGGGTNGPVAALAVKGNDLYAGGFFTTIGATSYNHIAKWNIPNQSWSALGVSPNDGTNGEVRALAFKGADLYVGGKFTTAGGSTANNVAKWKTTSPTGWSALGDGAGDQVRALAVKGNDLYVGGFFTTVGTGPVAANYIAKVNVNTKVWSALGLGTGGNVHALAFMGNDLYVGGEFGTAGGSGSNAFAKWSTTPPGAWTAFGASSPNNPVRAFAVKGTYLYVGGALTMAGTVGVNYMAEYDTVNNTWSGCGNGLTDAVLALAKKGSDIYVGGAFGRMAGIPVGRVAQFKTSTGQWLPLGGGVDGNVYALLVKGNDVYVGGSFSNAYNPNGNPVAANNIAVWSTTKKQWSALIGGGVNNGVQGTVYALAVMGNNLYVGGGFEKIGLNDALHVARWDIKNKAWDHLAEGMNGDVYVLVVKGQYLYAGGAFTTAGDKNPANHVAAFDTVHNSWEVLGNLAGNGTDGTVYALAFTNAGGRSYMWWGGDFHNVYTPGSTISQDYIYAGNMNPPHDQLDVGETNGPVRALLPVGPRMYVAGDFTKTNPGDPSELPVNYIAWGSQAAGWQAMGSGLGGSARALTAIGQDIYVGGMFPTAGGKPSLYLARWMGP